MKKRAQQLDAAATVTADAAQRPLPLTPKSEPVSLDDDDSDEIRSTASSSVGEGAAAARCGGGAAAAYKLSRDERKAVQLGIPFTVQDIIYLPMDEFTDLLSRHDLNEDQLNLCRDVRRRGKNKVAAQNCRKRKLQQIEDLEVQVAHTRARKDLLRAERQQLMQQMSEWGSVLAEVEDEVLTRIDRNVKDFTLELDHANELRVTRRPGGGGGRSSASAPSMQVGMEYIGRVGPATSTSSVAAARQQQGDSRFLSASSRRHWKKDNMRDLK